MGGACPGEERDGQARLGHPEEHLQELGLRSDS